MARIFLTSFIFMQIVSVLTAQQERPYSIHWKDSGLIPASTGQSKALGLAGAIIGKDQNFLIVAGGSNFPDSMPWVGGKKKYYDDVFVFVQNKSGEFKLHAQSRLPFTIAYSTSASLTDGVVFAGGENENGISKKAFLLKWNETKRNVILHSLPDLPKPLTNASIVASNNKLYVAGGEKRDGVSNDLLVLDLNNISNGWKLLCTIPVEVSHAVMFKQLDGKHDCLYIVGGRKKRIDSTSVLYANNWKFDIQTKMWTRKKPLPHALSAGAGMAVGENYLMMFGGDKGKTFHETEELIVSIKNEADASRREKLNEEKIRIQETHPGFSKEVLLYNTISDEWSTLDSIPFEVPVTTTAVKWGNTVVIPGGEIRAGVRSAKILLGEVVTHHK